MWFHDTSVSFRVLLLLRWEILLPLPHLAWISVVLPWTKCLRAAKTGWKPNRKLAQGSALDNSEQSNLRSERAKGRNEYFTGSCCAYSALDSRYTCTQGVTLGCIPFGASPRPCSLHQLLCHALGLSFCWNFAPSLLVTTVAAHCTGIKTFWDFVPLLPLTTAATAMLWGYHFVEISLRPCP